MADDIDIEEHDILDNPQIKYMFTDISSIKDEMTGSNGEDKVNIHRENVERCQESVVAVDENCENRQNSSPNVKETIFNPESQYDIDPNHQTTLGLKDQRAKEITTNSSQQQNIVTNITKRRLVKKSISTGLKIQHAQDGEGNFCEQCNKALIPVKFKCDLCTSIYDTRAEFEIHKDKHKNECLRCNVCTCQFEDRAKFIRHMKIRHKLNYQQFELVATDCKCAYCGVTLKNFKLYNIHIANRHSDFYRKVIEDIEKYVASSFKPTFSEKIHKAMNLIDTSALATDDVFEPIKSSQKPDVTCRTIPKSILFKCPKCQIHFVFCSVAIEHEKVCLVKRSDWKCHHCYRSFKKADSVSHLQQHKLSDRFRTVKASSDILRKLLYKCTSCIVCFDEISLLKYHAKGCTDDNSERCNIKCNSLIYGHAIDNHKKMHKELGHVPFITVDVVCVEQIQTDTLKSSENSESLLRPPKVQTRRSEIKEMVSFYCQNCQCFVKVTRQESSYPKKFVFTLYQCLECNICLHRKSNVTNHVCKSDYMKKRCNICHMQFSCWNYKFHLQAHKEWSFTNINLRIVQFEDNKVIDSFQNRKSNSSSLIELPSLTRKECCQSELNSEYVKRMQHRLFKCRKCKLLFITPSAMMTHQDTCQNNSKGVKCEKCGLVFHPTHLDLHEKYKKSCTETDPLCVITLNKDGYIYDEEKSLYSCVKCSLTFLTFRAVLYHMKKNHAVKVKTYKCEICDKTLTTYGHRDHKSQHAKENLTSADFINFEVYDYKLQEALADLPNSFLIEQKLREKITFEENIFSDEIIMAQDITNCETAQEIGEERKVPDKNMEIPKQDSETDSNYGIKVFKCRVCNLHLNSQTSLYRHSYRGSHNEERYKCKYCGKCFPRQSLVRHTKKHRAIAKSRKIKSKIIKKLTTQVQY